MTILSPQAIHLAHVACGGERLDIVLAKVFHQLREFVVGEQRLQLNRLLVGIAADDLVKRAATIEIVDDVTADAVVVFRDDAHTLSLVEVGREHIHHHAIDPCGNEADDHHLEGIDEESREADDGTRHAHRLAHVEVQVFVDDFGQDVETASGSVDGEHQCLGGAEDDDAAEQVEPRVAHHRKSLAGIYTHVYQVAVRRSEVFPGINPFAELSHRTEDQGTVNRFEAELLANEQVGQNQQDGVDDGDHHGQADVDTHAVKDVGQHDGKTRDGANDQLAGNQEIIDANTRHKHTEGHDQQLYPELLADQRLTDFIQNFIHNYQKKNYLNSPVISTP